MPRFPCWIAGPGSLMARAAVALANAFGIRVTEDGSVRTTETGDTRVIETGGGSSSYATGAVNFDRATYLTRSAVLAGANDSPTGSLVCWVKGGSANLDTGGGSVDDIGSDANPVGGNFAFGPNSVPDPRSILYIANSDFSSEHGALTLTDALYYSDTWLCHLLSWNTGFASGSRVFHWYTGDNAVSMDAPYESGGAFDVAWTVVWPALFGGGPGNPPWFAGDASDFYLNTSEFIDFSVEANRRKFIDASGKPVDLGLDGSTPTGSAPTVFLRIAPAGVESTYAANLGTGGPFDITGTLTSAATSPSD